MSSITDEQRNYYVNNVCSVCTNFESCSRDKFIATAIYDRLSIKCLSYEYKDKGNTN